jgi:hypothetical protein
MDTPSNAPSLIAPPTVARPELARWIWERDLTLREAAELFSCSPEQVRLMCLPFSDPRRRAPDDELRERITEVTGGEILLRHYFPLEFRGGDPEVLRQARSL